MKAEMTGSVYIVEDDAGVAAALASMLATYGLRVATFASAEAFLSVLDTLPSGCVVADVRMPGLSGIELQLRISRARNDLPVILISGHGDIPMAVAAIKQGAADFLEKPVDDVALTAAIRRALAAAVAARDIDQSRAGVRARYGRLTNREAQVMALVVSGRSNAEIAATLGLSQRTVEHYRAQVMVKMEAPNLAMLVQQSVTLKEPP